MGLVAGLAAVSTNFAASQIGNDAQHYASRSPDPKAGQTLPMERKGVVFYISARQQHYRELLFYAFVASATAAVTCIGVILALYGREGLKRHV